MSWLSSLLPTLLGGWLSGEASEDAAAQAQQMSAEQRALLSQILAWGQQYGSPLLEQYWDWAQHPGETPFEQQQWELLRGDLDRSFRPAYFGTQNYLSQRNALTSPGSLAGSMLSSLERQRAQSLAQFHQQRRAGRAQEQGKRLASFSDLLAQLRGGNVGAAQAYNEPIQTYADLAQQTGGGIGSAFGSLQMMQALQGLLNQGGGSTGAGPFLTYQPDWATSYTGQTGYTPPAYQSTAGQPGMYPWNTPAPTTTGGIFPW